MGLEPDTDDTVMLIKQIIDGVVDNPEEVQYEVIISESRVLIEIRGGTETGKILGRKGRLIDSIRIMLEAVTGKTKKRYAIEVL